MRSLLSLWEKECRALLRDLHGLLALFVMPAIFILVMSLALQDAFAPDKAVELGYAVLDLDHSAEATALAQRLRSQSSLRALPPASDMRDALEQLRQQRAAFVLVIPADFGQSMQDASGQFALRTPLRLLADPTLGAAVETAFRNQILATLGAQRVNAFLEHVRRQLPGVALAQVPAANWQQQLQTQAVHASSQTAAMPNAVQQSVPAWLVFSMFFVVVPISAIFIGERQQGTLQRLRSQRVPYGRILLGKLLPFFVLNQIQALCMLLVGCWIVPLLGADALTLPAQAAAAWALWCMAAAVSLAAVCWALLIASLVRTTEQATIVGGVGNILMGAVGGIMVPSFIMPAPMQRIAAFSPMAWGLEGFHAVLLREGALPQIVPYAAPLLVFAALALAAAALTGQLAARART